MATAVRLAHFHGPDVLDPLFRDLVQRGMKPVRAKFKILEDVQEGNLSVKFHVAEGAWALETRQFATKEEEEQARDELRAAANRFDFAAQARIMYERSPPGGITEIIDTEDWGLVYTLLIREGHLVIKFLVPKFPPESYSFAIACPEAV